MYDNESFNRYFVNKYIIMPQASLKLQNCLKCLKFINFLYIVIQRFSCLIDNLVELNYTVN